MPADLTREEIERLRSTARAFPVAHHAMSLSAETLLRLLEMASPTRIEAARQEGFRQGIEAAARCVEGGSFLHDDAPPARWAREAAPAIRRLSPPPAKPSAPVAPDWPTRCAALEADGIAARKRVAALEAENAALREGLEKAAAQFEFYQGQHEAKGTREGREKARTNGDMALMCRALLQGGPDAG